MRGHARVVISELKFLSRYANLEGTNIRFIPQFVLSAAILTVWGVPSTVALSTPPSGAALHFPTDYVLISPVSRVLDTLTILSNPQSIALFLSLAAIVIARVIMTRARSGRAPLKRIAVSLLT